MTSVLLFIADRIQTGHKGPKNISYTNGFIIGICQGIATLPGLSRSGTTIASCLISGFDRKFAVKYSFIMSIPAVLGAAILELKDFSPASVSGTEVAYYLVGMAVAAVVGYICIKTDVSDRQKQKIYHLFDLLSSDGGIFDRSIFLYGIRAGGNHGISFKKKEIKEKKYNGKCSVPER